MWLVMPRLGSPSRRCQLGLVDKWMHVVSLGLRLNSWWRLYLCYAKDDIKSLEAELGLKESNRFGAVLVEVRTECYWDAYIGH